MKNMLLAGNKVLQHRKYLLLFLFLTIFIFWLLLAIPVKTVPGNDFGFQLSILGWGEIVLLILLSVLTAFSITLNVFSLSHKRSLKTSASMIGQGATGFFSGAVATVFGTATCAYCVSAIFGFMGVSGVLFLIQYRTVITIGAILLLLISLYFTSQKVLGICTVCHVKRGES